MAKIRHVAVKAEDPDKLANFYINTFGMKEVARGTVKRGVQSIYLSDGYINLAILAARGDAEGIHHFGFGTENMEETGRVAKAEGARKEIAPRPKDGRFAEFRIHDPVGIPVDLSEKGWKI